MLKMLNGLFVIASVGLIMAMIFLGGQGLAHNEQVMDVFAQRWYLLAAFVLTVGLALMTNRKKRPSYED